jgi:hypothetical protein
VVIGLGLARFSILIELTPTWDFYIKWYSTFVINVLVPVNAALAVLLIHKDGLKGLQLLTYVAAWLMSGLLSFLIYMGHIFGALGQVGLDIMLRIIIVVLIIAVYIITTPLDAINQRVSSPYKEKPAINT